MPRIEVPGRPGVVIYYDKGTAGDALKEFYRSEKEEKQAQKQKPVTEVQTSRRGTAVKTYIPDQPPLSDPRATDLDVRIHQAAQEPQNGGLRKAIKWLFGNTTSDNRGGVGTRKAVGRATDPYQDGHMDIEVFETENGTTEIGLTSRGRLEKIDERDRRHYILGCLADGTSPNGWTYQRAVDALKDKNYRKDINEMRRLDRQKPLSDLDFALRIKQLSDKERNKNSQDGYESHSYH